MKRIVGFALLLIGALTLLSGLFFSHGISFFKILLSLILLFVGWKLAEFTAPPSQNTARAGSKPHLPEDFNADFWHKNIALNSNSGALWVKEKSGKTCVFQRNEVVGWEMQNSNFTSQAAVGPRITPMDNRLVIKTKSLEKPVWTVPFDSHGSLTGRANHQNHEEMKAWFERLNIVYNHPA